MRNASINIIFNVSAPANLHCLLLLTVFFTVTFASFGQAPPTAPTPSLPAPGKNVKTSPERQFFKNILKDQSSIWTSPFRLKKDDLKWLLPLAAGTATLLTTDRRTAGALNNNQSRIDFSLDVSRFGSAYTTGGTALAFYTVGKLTHNERAQETGLLAGEALIDSGIVVTALKFITQRPRPFKRNGHGNFFTGGNSFPSGHSVSAWALAAIISDEYGSRHSYIKYGAYGLATAVSLSRYTARKHFLGDILVGSAIGYGIGHFTFRRHHDPALDSANAVTKMTKLEKYFPVITPQYERSGRIYGANLAWNF